MTRFLFQMTRFLFQITRFLFKMTRFQNSDTALLRLIYDKSDSGRLYLIFKLALYFQWLGIALAEAFRAVWTDITMKVGKTRFRILKVMYFVTVFILLMIIFFQMYPWCLEVVGYPPMFLFHAVIMLLTAVFIVR